MLAYTIVSQGTTVSSCPHLGLASEPGCHSAIPCSLNICRADPLRRKGPCDLPLTCQADWCLSGDYHRCPYWLNCSHDRISVAAFILRHMRTLYAVCTRALQP